MDQAPNYYNYVSTQFGPAPPPYMCEQFQPQYHHEDYSFHEQHPAADPFTDAVNAEVWAALQAYHTMDAQSLHQAYANLGFVLGIDRACTYFVQSYSKANSAYGGRKLFYKKDWDNLEAMVADIDNEKKILHVEDFMRRRRIPGYVSLYAPKQIVCKSEEKVVKQEKISCVDACRDEVMRLDVACQTLDLSTISLNVACQTDKFRGLETGCQTEKIMGLESACQTDKFIGLEIACQTVEKSVGLSVSCQTVDKSAGSSVSCQTTEPSEKSTRKSVDKVVRKDSDNRKRARGDEQDSHSTKRSKHSDCTGGAKSSTEASENKKLSCAKDDKIARKDSDSHKNPGDQKVEASATSERMRQALVIAKKDILAKFLYESKKKLLETVDTSRKSSDKDSSDNCKRDRDVKSETRGTDRSVSHSKRTDSKDNSQKSRVPKSSASKTDAVDGEKSSRKSNDKIVHKGSSDNCKRASNKSENCSTNRSESSSMRSDSKDIAQKCEATKGSASKKVSCRTTVAVDSKKVSRDAVATSKAVKVPENGDAVAEIKKPSSHCKENAQHLGMSSCHVTKLVIQNLHPLVNDADISTIFSAFKSYKSSKVNFYNYGKLGAADVVFEEEADALEAKNQFDGKKLDGFPMQIVVVKSEKN